MMIYDKTNGNQSGYHEFSNFWHIEPPYLIMFSQDQKSKINILTSFQLVAVSAYHLDFFPEQWNELICLTLRIMHILLATLSFVQGHTDTIISLVLSAF